MLLSNIAIRRPVFTGMVILAMIVFGSLSFNNLGRDLFPKVDFPIVAITTTWRGADPETMETRVAQPLEDATSTLSGLKSLRSTSAEGYTMIVAEFQLEKNIDVAYQEVQSKVNAVRSTLPQDVDDPVIQKFDPDSAPIMTVIVSGEKSDRDMYYLVNKQVKERLQRIKDVGAVKIVGGRDRKVWLSLRPGDLDKHGLTVQDVRAALARQHIEVPGGRIETGAKEYVTRTKAEFTSAAELNEMILTQSDAGTIRLKDVGEAEDGLEEERSYSQLDTKPGLALQVRRQSGANTVQVANDVKAEVEKMKGEMAAEGISFKVAMDNSTYIKQSLANVEEHLIVGGAFAVVTVLLFLLNFRSTFICTLVLPTSVLSTFIVLSLAGFSLNFMTLMALMLAIGLLIDDAIVVQENIMRHVQEGQPARWAAEFATKEIGLAVMATTFSVVAVFMPTAFTKGIVGRFFFPFGVTVSAAVLISMFVSFTLDPMMSSRLLKKQTKMNVVFRGLERAFQTMERVYEKMLGFALRWRWLVVGTAVVILAGALGLSTMLKSEFLPVEDQSELLVNVRTELGSSLDATRKVMDKVRDEVARNREVDYTFYSIGADEMQKVNEASMYVRLKPKAERQRGKLRSQQDLMDSLRKQFAGKWEQATVSVQMVDMMGGGGGMKTQTVQYMLSGNNFGELSRQSDELTEKMRAKGGYTDLDTTYEPGKPGKAVVINRNVAEALGVSPADVADTVSAAVGGVKVAKFKADGERYDMAVRFREHGRNRPESLEALRVPTMAGGSVELRAVAHVVDSPQPVEINRYNRQRQITVLANLEKGKILGEAVQEINGFGKDLKVPAGYRTTWVGNASDMEESFTNLLVTMGLSVLVTYMILAAQFESLVHPFTIMLSLPLAFVGALVFLLVFGQTLSIFVMMAFIFLLGLVTKNAILLIDYANELRRRHGMARDAALRKAGPVRLRPILMTTMAMVLGMMPAAVGTGEGSESRMPMAVAIIGGLVSSTLLTLLVVPVVYSLLDPISEAIRTRFLETSDEGMPVDGKERRERVVVRVEDN